jgi:hypothetical protein
MAKRRKTKEQKILADLRHNFRHNYIGEAPSAQNLQIKLTPNIPGLQKTIEQKAPKTIALNSYPYLAKDLAKTAVLTLTIFAIQIILFTLLRNHALVIPGISY